MFNREEKEWGKRRRRGVGRGMKGELAHLRFNSDKARAEPANNSRAGEQRSALKDWNMRANFLPPARAVPIVFSLLSALPPLPSVLPFPLLLCFNLRLAK